MKLKVNKERMLNSKTTHVLNASVYFLSVIKNELLCFTLTETVNKNAAVLLIAKQERKRRKNYITQICDND